MKTIPDADETAKQINQALDDNAALTAKIAQLEEENARLRKHMELQQREMEALQAEHGGKATDNKGSREKQAGSASSLPPNSERKERRMVQLVRR